MYVCKLCIIVLPSTVQYFPTRVIPRAIYTFPNRLSLKMYRYKRRVLGKQRRNYLNLSQQYQYNVAQTCGSYSIAQVSAYRNTKTGRITSHVVKNLSLISCAQLMKMGTVLQQFCRLV